MQPQLFDINGNVLYAILADLSSKRPFFYSEMDFQFCLGWALQEEYNKEVIFEKRFDLPAGQAGNTQRQYIDIILRDGEHFIPIELKYKTKKAVVREKDGRDYTLLDQSAQDLGCYHFVRDIARIEGMKREPGFIRGFTIILTNDPYYYEPGGKRNPSYEDFLLYESTKTRLLHGSLVWKEREDRYPAITLGGAYPISSGSWRVYSESPQFRYLLFEIA